MGWGVADIPVANGTVLIGPISAIPGAFIRKTDVMATRRVLHLVRHSSAAMQELRREWAAISLLTVPERMTDDQLIQHVDYGVARRTLAVMLIARDQSNFVARPAEKPRLIQPESVADWTASEKIVAALRASGGHLGGEMRRMIEELIDPVNVAVTVGLILALVAANAMGWGVIADAVLVIFAYAAAGIAGIKAIGQFIETTIDVIDARSAGEIDQAGKEYAHAFRVLGTAFLARFLGKAKAKRAGASERAPRGGSAKPAAKPSAKPQQKPSPTKPARDPIVEASVAKMPAAWQAEYRAAEAAGWKKPDGTTWWPPNNGGIGTPLQTKLPEGFKLDRYGDEAGSYLSGAGDSIASRAMKELPKGAANIYEVTARGAKRLVVEKSEIAPWFGQAGGGTQYRLVDLANPNAKYSISDAIQDGLLAGPK